MKQAGLKDAVRTELLGIRRTLSVSDRRDKSLAISKRLALSDSFQRAGSIHFYLSNGAEVQTDSLIQEALDLKKQVLVPIINLDQKRLFFSELFSLHSDTLEAGPFGIRQPKPAFQKRVKKSEIHLWVVPGLGFDLEGNRIGYGGGYYDKVLKEVSATVIGLAFDFQIVDKLPLESTDCPVNQIMTETRTIFCRKDKIGCPKN